MIGRSASAGFSVIVRFLPIQSIANLVLTVRAFTKSSSDLALELRVAIAPSDAIGSMLLVPVQVAEGCVAHRHNVRGHWLLALRLTRLILKPTIARQLVGCGCSGGVASCCQNQGLSCHFRRATIRRERAGRQRQRQAGLQLADGLPINQITRKAARRLASQLAHCISCHAAGLPGRTGHLAVLVASASRLNLFLAGVHARHVQAEQVLGGAKAIPVDLQFVF